MGSCRLACDIVRHRQGRRNPQTSGNSSSSIIGHPHADRRRRRLRPRLRLERKKKKEREKKSHFIASPLRRPRPRPTPSGTVGTLTTVLVAPCWPLAGWRDRTNDESPLSCARVCMTATRNLLTPANGGVGRFAVVCRLPPPTASLQRLAAHNQCTQSMHVSARITKAAATRWGAQTVV